MLAEQIAAQRKVMTAQPRPEYSSTSLRLPPLPDPPRKTDMQENLHFDRPAEMNTLARYLGALSESSTTFVAGRGYLCQRRGDLPSCPYPDMIVAFDVAAAEIGAANGYVIEEAGKPPDLVLEVASSHTARRDYTVKRDIYAGMGVTEFWRFDHTGGDYYDAALSGDRLTPAGVYRPVELTTEPDGVIWGYSEALGLSLCWVNRRLRLWDRAARQYLLDPSELEEALRLSRVDLNLAEAQRNADRDRIRQLEEQLRRLQSPGS